MLLRQRLTIPDFLATRREARERGNVKAQIALAYMTQARNGRAEQLRKSFTVIPGGLPSSG